MVPKTLALSLAMLEYDDRDVGYNRKFSVGFPGGIPKIMATLIDVFSNVIQDFEKSLS